MSDYSALLDQKTTAPALSEDKNKVQAKLNAAVKDFVAKELTHLSGEKFAFFDKSAIGKGPLLSGIRYRLIKKREENLAALESDFPSETIRLEDLPLKLEQAKKALATADQTYLAAEKTAARAINVLGKWITTDKSDFVALSRKIAKNQKLPPLTSENRAFYEPKSGFRAAINWLTRNNDYREVREILESFHRETPSKDALSLLPLWEKRQKALEDRYGAAMIDTIDEQHNKFRRQKTCSKIDAAITTSFSDAQILEKIQENASFLLATNAAYRTAIANAYGADFPQDILLLSATAAIKPQQPVKPYKSYDPQ